MTDAPKRDTDMSYVEPPVARFIEHVLREIRALPEVKDAALAGNVPMGPSASPGVGVRVAGRPEPDGNLRRAAFNVITSRFFETLRIPLRRGRYLEQQDVQDSAWVAVVNEAFAREFFPGGDALGQMIHLTAGPEERPREIVGVISDYTQSTPRTLVQPEVYTSHFQQSREIAGNFRQQRFLPKLLIRSNMAGTIKPEVIARIVAAFDRDLVVSGVRPLKHHIALTAAPVRFYANILGLFSAIAILLSAIGIYGLVNYSVTDRLHEIGIRVSFGRLMGTYHLADRFLRPETHRHRNNRGHSGCTLGYTRYRKHVVRRHAVGSAHVLDRCLFSFRSCDYSLRHPRSTSNNH